MALKPEQRNQAIAESLRAAGVGASYRNPEVKLSSLGEVGDKLATDLQSGEVRQSVELGWTWVIEGCNQRHNDIMHLMCRGMILHRIPSRLVSAVHLNTIIQDKEVDESDALGDVHCLFIQGWFDHDYPDAFTTQELNRLGWWLYQWTNSGRALVLQATSDKWKQPPSKGGWWSTHIVNQILDKVTIIT